MKMKVVAGLISLSVYVSTLNIQIEPLVFMLSACNAARQTVLPQLMQEKMERTYEAPEGLNETDLKKFYNKKMVRWDQYFTYVNLPTASIFGIFYGAYSDRMGRKLPILVGITSLAVDTAFRMLVLGSSTDFPLIYIVVGGVITGIMGNFQLFMSAMNAYAADIFPVKKTLSKRMVIISVTFSLGAFAGSLLTKYLIKKMTAVIILLIAQTCIAVAMAYALTFIETRKPTKKSLLTASNEEQTDVKDSERKRLTPLIILKNSINSLVDSVKIFLVSREGHRRCFLYFTILAAFLDQFVFEEEKSLIGTYSRLSPFNWETDDYALYKTIRSVTQIGGMFFGLIVLKQFCKLSDTVLIILSIISMGLCALVIGLAETSWLLYASIGAGSLHGLLNPLTLTFISCLVKPDEIGKAFAINSIAGKLADISNTVVLDNIYIVTVVWWQGFVWILMSAISLLAALLYLIMYIVSKRDEL